MTCTIPYFILMKKYDRKQSKNVKEKLCKLFPLVISVRDLGQNVNAACCVDQLISRFHIELQIVGGSN